MLGILMWSTVCMLQYIPVKHGGRSAFVEQEKKQEKR